MSVIVPARNAANTLGRALVALQASSWRDFELIVVDDASADDTAEIARRHGAQVVRMPAGVGPAAARNRGAAVARGDLLLFVDADVCVHEDALERMAAHFLPVGGGVPDGLAAQPAAAGEGVPARVDAVFGSYDDSPPPAGFIALYKNLAHHYVHRTGSPEAHTFWAGCGVMRKDVFDEVGGFDESYREASIEDIELGYRLSDAGRRILLDPDVQGTHLKVWTFRSMVDTDIRCRAIPWLRLLRAQRRTSTDLNLGQSQRASVAILYTAVLCSSLALLSPPDAASFLGAAMVAILIVVFLNRGFYRFLRRSQGGGFALRSVPVHLFYFLYCGGAVFWVRIFATPRR